MKKEKPNYESFDLANFLISVENSLKKKKKKKGGY